MLIANSINTPEDTLRIIVRTFFSDVHIIIIELILKENYTTDYSISTELKMGIDRIRLATNNLINEKLISYEERIFKNLKVRENIKKIPNKKGFKLRYLYFDKISFVYNIKKKFKKVVSAILLEKTRSLDSFLICPRKVCKKFYKIRDVRNLSIDKKGGFYCNNVLHFNVICGTKLIKEEKNLEIKTESFKDLRKVIDSIYF